MALPPSIFDSPDEYQAPPVRTPEEKAATVEEERLREENAPGFWESLWIAGKHTTPTGSLIFNNPTNMGGDPNYVPDSGRIKKLQSMVGDDRWEGVIQDADSDEEFDYLVDHHAKVEKALHRLHTEGWAFTGTIIANIFDPIYLGATAATAGLFGGVTVGAAVGSGVARATGASVMKSALKGAGVFAGAEAAVSIPRLAWDDYWDTDQAAMSVGAAFLLGGGVGGVAAKLKNFRSLPDEVIIRNLQRSGATAEELSKLRVYLRKTATTIEGPDGIEIPLYAGRSEQSLAYSDLIDELFTKYNINPDGGVEAGMRELSLYISEREFTKLDGLADDAMSAETLIQGWEHGPPSNLLDTVDDTLHLVDTEQSAALEQGLKDILDNHGIDSRGVVNLNEAVRNIGDELTEAEVSTLTGLMRDAQGAADLLPGPRDIPTGGSGGFTRTLDPIPEPPKFPGRTPMSQQPKTRLSRWFGWAFDGPNVRLRASDNPSVVSFADELSQNPLPNQNTSVFSALQQAEQKTEGFLSTFFKGIRGPVRAGEANIVPSAVGSRTTGAINRSGEQIVVALRANTADDLLPSSVVEGVKVTRAHMKKLWQYAKDNGVPLPDKFDPTYFPRVWSERGLAQMDREMGVDAVNEMLRASLRSGTTRMGKEWSPTAIDQVVAHVGKVLRSDEYKSLARLRQQKPDAWASAMNAAKSELSERLGNEGLDPSVAEDIFKFLDINPSGSPGLPSFAHARLPFDEQIDGFTRLLNNNLEDTIRIQTQKIVGYIEWRKALARSGHDPDMPLGEVLSKIKANPEDRNLITFLYNDLMAQPHHGSDLGMFAGFLRDSMDITSSIKGGLMGISSWSEVGSVVAWNGIKYAGSIVPGYTKILNAIQTGSFKDPVAMTQLMEMLGAGQLLRNRHFSSRAVRDFGYFGGQLTGRVSRFKSDLLTDFRRVVMGRYNPAGVGGVATEAQRAAVMGSMKQWSNLAYTIEGGVASLRKGWKKVTVDRLKSLGATDDMIDDILRVMRDPDIVQIKNRGGKHEIVDWNFSAWPKEILDDFEALAVAQYSKIVQRVDAADIPLFYQHPLGRLVFQFMSHPIAAVNKKVQYHTLSADRVSVFYLSVAAAFAALGAAAKSEIKIQGMGLSDAEKSQLRNKWMSPGRLAGEAWRMHDGLGFFADAAGLVSSLTPYGDPFAGNRKSRGPFTEAATHPPAGQVIDDFWKALMTTGELGVGTSTTKETIEAWTKVMPLQNLMGMPQLMNQLTQP